MIAFTYLIPVFLSALLVFFVLALNYVQSLNLVLEMVNFVLDNGEAKPKINPIYQPRQAELLTILCKSFTDTDTMNKNYLQY
jgi:hypothetical protein